MPVERVENKCGTEVKALIAYYGSDCGRIGPRVSVEDMNFNTYDVPVSQIADFLNDNCCSGNRTISHDAEKRIAELYSDVLEVSPDGQYLFVGEKLVDIFGYYRSSYHEAKKEQGEISEALRQADSVGHTEAQGHFGSQEASAVLQHEVKFTTSSMDKPILGSYGAGPCVILAAHNPESGSAALFHIDALTGLGEVEKLLLELSNGNQMIDVHLRGGDASSRKTAADLVGIITKNKHCMNLKSSCLCTGGEPKSLAIDARSGDIYTDFNHTQLDAGPNQGGRIASIAMETWIRPLKRLK